ncbi:MAG: ABC transporter ATP-binding protein, partial [Caldisphaeraceae archaeon]|nr:ABC transporter ATP-binding protein [Caldisphaeraceae archaeon]
AREFRRMIKMLSHDKTVFFTSHYMGEIDELSDIVFFIKNGKIILKGSVEELKERVGKVIEIIMPERHVNKTITRFVVNLRYGKAYLRIPKRCIDFIDPIKNNMEIIGESEPSLEDAYVILVGGQN